MNYIKLLMFSHLIVMDFIINYIVKLIIKKIINENPKSYIIVI